MPSYTKVVKERYLSETKLKAYLQGRFLPDTYSATASALSLLFAFTTDTVAALHG